MWNGNDRACFARSLWSRRVARSNHAIPATFISLLRVLRVPCRSAQVRSHPGFATAGATFWPPTDGVSIASGSPSRKHQSTPRRPTTAARNGPCRCLTPCPSDLPGGTPRQSCAPSIPPSGQRTRVPHRRGPRAPGAAPPPAAPRRSLMSFFTRRAICPAAISRRMSCRPLCSGSGQAARPLRRHEPSAWQVR